MAEDREESGGFFISLGSIINVVAASAIGGLAIMAIGNNSDIASLKITVGDQGLEIRRLDNSYSSIEQTLTTILGNQRGLEDASGSNAADYKRLHEELQDARKDLSDLEHGLQPPRGSGH